MSRIVTSEILMQIATGENRVQARVIPPTIALSRSCFLRVKGAKIA